MKRILSILLVCSVVMGVSACADGISYENGGVSGIGNSTAEIDYSYYLGSWNWGDEPVLEIYRADNGQVDFKLQFADFCVEAENAFIKEDSSVYAESVWKYDGSIDKDIAKLQFGVEGISVSWGVSHNGDEPDMQTFSASKPDFEFRMKGNINVTVNGEKLNFDQAPVMVNNRVLVPLRKICEKIGAEIYYEQTGIDTIVIIKNSQFVLLAKGISYGQDAEEGNWQISKCTLSDMPYDFCTILNYEKERSALDADPVILNGRTLVPVRVITEYLGGMVDWNEGTKTVEIKIPVSESRSAEEIDKIALFNEEKAVNIFKELFGSPYGDDWGLYLSCQVYSKKGRAFLFANPVVENQEVCIYHDGTVEYVNRSNINFIGDSDSYTKYCNVYTKEFNPGTSYASAIRLYIRDVNKSNVIFNIEKYSMNRAITMTADKGYCTGDNTAEATGTYSDPDGDYLVKYYFIFGSDYIDFKYELYGTNGYNYSADADYIRFYL